MSENAPESVNPTSWAAIIGDWVFDRDADPEVATFVTPPRAEDGSLSPIEVGWALTDLRMSSGRLSCTVTLPETDMAGRIAFGYNAASPAYYSIGIGGDPGAYVLDRFNVALGGWAPIRWAGHNKNLTAGEPYYLVVDVYGQLFRLFVDGIEVLAGVLPEPPSGEQVGLVAWGRGGIRFEDLEMVAERPRLFVVMHFAEPYDSLFEQVIEPVAEQEGYGAFRASDIAGPGVILQDITESINRAAVVLAEVSPVNANVYYELGYAHAIGKPVIIMADRATGLPFDISGYRCIFYDNTIAGKTEVEGALRRHLRALGGTT